MRKLKTLFALLVLSFFTIGQVWGTDVDSGTSQFSSVNGSLDANISYASAKAGGTTAPVINNSNIRLYRNNSSSAALGSTLTVSAKNGATITAITFTLKSSLGYSYSVNGGAATTGTGSSIALTKLEATSVTLQNYSSSQMDVKRIQVTYTPAVSTDPTVSLTPANLEDLDAEGAGEQTVKVKCANFGSNIAINTAFFDNAACSGEAISTPAWIEDFTKIVPTTASTDTTITFSVADNDGAARETWLRVDASDGTKKDTTILHISQKLYVAPLATMDAIFAKAKEVKGTATDVRIAFDNWVITGVNGAEAFVTDGTKGFRIYKASHGFKVGDKLSGTVACQVKLYTGVAQVSEITSTSDGLTVTSDTEIIPVVKTISDLDSINTGALVTIKDVTYKSSTTSFVDADEKSIAPFSTFYSGSFTNNIKYNVTGIFQSYSGAKRILPRSADDIYSVPVVTTTVSSLSFEAKQNNAVAGKKFSLTGVSLKGNLTITASEGFSVDKESITPTAAGAVAATEITVTPATPTTTTSVEGTVTISSEGLEDIVINLSMTVTPTFAVNVVVSPAGKATATINGGSVAYVANEEIFNLAAAANVPAKYAFAGWTVAEADETKIAFDDATLEETTAYVTGALTITANYDSITTPSLAVLPDAINFGQVDILSVQAGETFTITGAHLKTAVTLALNGEKDDDFTYELEDGSLTPDGQENVSATIRVKPVTEVAGTYNGQLIVHSEEAGNQTVDLSVTVNRIAAGLEWSAEEATDTLNGGLHVRPTLSNPNKLAVVYSSTKTSVAEIDANGVITLKGVGTTTISAASEQTAICLAGGDSYELTVQRVDTVKWMVNGVEHSRQTGLAGSDIVAPTPAALDGKSFVGWATAAIDGVTDEAPALSTPTSMPDGGNTFYAVFAHLDSEGSESWDLVTNASSLQKNDIITVTSTCTYNYKSTAYYDTVAYAGANSTLGALVPIGITNNKIRTVKSGSISEIKLVEGSTAGKFKLYDIAEEKYLNPANKAISYDETGNDLTISITDDVASITDDTYTLQYNPNMQGTQYANARFAYYSSSQKAIQIYKKNITPAEYSAYATDQYAVTIGAHENGTLVVKKGDDAITSGDKFWTGTTLTVEAAPASANYKAGVVEVTGATLDAGSFTIGTSDVNVSATFAEKAAAGLAWKIADDVVDAATVKIGATDNVFPTLSNTNGLDVTYTSGTVATATIAADGAITLVAEGTTLISAIFEGDGDYKAQTVSYTLTVNKTATALDNTEASVKAVKKIVNGQLFIEKNGRVYNAFGQTVK